MSNALDGKLKEKQEIWGKLKIANDVMRRVQSLKDKFEVDDGSAIEVWVAKLKNARNKCWAALYTINNNDEKVRREKEIKEIDKKIERCLKATLVLKELPLLSSFADSFVKKNIDKIKRFFMRLHTPREFDDLALEGSVIKAHRVTTNEWVKPCEMSSGQRASFALAVLFTLHLAATNAPRFILLDEPVANMDDLHLLNLIEVIRDLSLEGRQVFFSTSNPTVANIFRRKFSFMKNDFKCYSLTRKGNHPVEISELSFLPDKEEPIRRNVAG